MSRLPDFRLETYFSKWELKLSETSTDRFRIGFGRRGMDEGLAVLDARLQRVTSRVS